MRDYLLTAAGHDKDYERVRIRAKARLQPIRLHGPWVDDATLIKPDHCETVLGYKPGLRRPYRNPMPLRRHFARLGTHSGYMFKEVAHLRREMTRCFHYGIPKDRFVKHSTERQQELMTRLSLPDPWKAC
jgi:hypothetical protein